MKCESWCVDHNGEGGATCSIEPAFFGPEIDYGPEYGGVGRAGEVFAYRQDSDQIQVVVQCQGAIGPGAFINVMDLRTIHAALLTDVDGFADAVRRVHKDVDQ